MGPARRRRYWRWGQLAGGSPAASARIHFAAFAYVGESAENPLLYYQNNVAGSATLFRAIVDWRIIPVVFSSTCATYGVPEKIPIPEEHPQRPINPYGFSKLFVERMLGDLDQAHGLRSIALRYFNAAGADPDGEIGEAHDPEPHLIPRVLAAAQDGAIVIVYGGDYDTPHGTCIRDYIHVADIADAHVRALDYLLYGGPTCALNLANALSHSVMDVIQAAQRVSEKPVRVEMAPRRTGDPPVLIGSSDRVRAVLGWMPRRSALELQIADTWKWMQSRACA
jgi:UDP-arabinose 4-epimerase